MLLFLVPSATLRPTTPSWAAIRSAMPPQMSAVQDLTLDVAEVASLPAVASFFVDAFWLASTTFDGSSIELSASDRRQLTQKVAGDLGPRYGLSNDKRPTMMGGRRGFPSKSLFETRLIVAREPGGSIVGCAGIEAAFYDPSQGQLLRSDQADRYMRAELDVMTDDEAEEASRMYVEGGIGGFAKGIIQERFASGLVNKYMKAYTPCSILANLAVAPSYRRTGLGRALCDKCVECTTEEWKMDEIALQVEKANQAAVTLYERDGYRQVFSTDSATALRLQASEPTLFGGLPGPLSALAPENKGLLKEVSSPTLTLAKRLT